EGGGGCGDRVGAGGNVEGHRSRRVVLRLGVRRLDHGSGALDRRRQVTVDARVLGRLEVNRDRILARLVELASIPSVSTDPAHADDIERAARWVAAEVEAAGPFSVRIIPTDGNPVVY